MAVYRQNFSMLSSDSSEYGESFWENKLIYLRPNCSWTKPFRKMAVLTSISLTYSQEQQEGAHGVLTAVTDDEQEIVLASLFPRNPTQNTRLVWRSDQDLRFTNTGDNSLTLSILTKEVGA